MVQDLAWTVSEMKKYMAFSMMTQWTDGSSLGLCVDLIELHLGFAAFPVRWSSLGVGSTLDQ
jgi:hypothetical protein